MKKIFYITILIALFSFQSGKAQLTDGSISPDFTLTDLNGNTHNLYTYLAQGKTVYLDFFACHCPTCWAYHNQNEIENLNALHGPNGTQSQDVIVIAIEYDAGNGTNEFYGISGVTQGNWVSGSTHPFCNPEGSLRTQTLADFAVNYYPLIYGICPNKVIYNLGTQSAAQLYNYTSTCLTNGIVNEKRPSELIVNSSESILYIKSNNPGFLFSLYDISGKIIFTSVVEREEENIRIESLAKGVYYYQAEINGRAYRGKIIK